MNAVTTLSREQEVDEKVRKVRTFGRNARAVCVFLLFVLALVAAFALSMIARGPGSQGATSRIGLGAFTLSADQITTPELKVWAAFVVVATLGVAAWGVQRLFVLFNNLSHGAIYTAANVSLLRQIGLLTLLMGVLGIVIPVATAGLIAAGFIDGGALTKGQVVFGSNSFGSFISGGLVLLASWIMDLGLYTKDRAEALKRDADLVI